MKNYIVGACLLIILVIVFLYGKSCGTPNQPIHAAQVKTVDSAAIVAKAAIADGKRVRDSIAPIMARLQDSISILKTRVKPADNAMDGHVAKIKVLTDSIKSVKDSSAALSSLVNNLLIELENAGIDYQVQQGIKGSLISKLEAAAILKDSLISSNERLRANLVSVLSATQNAFHSSIAEDKKPIAQLRGYKVATKAEALVIAALVIKIALSK